MPDNIPNCTVCGKDLRNVSYRQPGYQYNNNRQSDNHTGGGNNFEDSVRRGLNNLGNSIGYGAQHVENNINRATDAVQAGYQNYKSQSEAYKKGSDAFIMSIVAVVLTFMAFNVISLVLGVIAFKWAKIGCSECNEHKFELAKAISLVAIVVSSIEVGAIVIGAIVSVVMLIVRVNLAYKDYSGIIRNFAAIVFGNIM
jgi:hypothetical protein